MHKKIHQRVKNAISTPEFIWIFTLRFIGNFLIISSLFLIVKTFYQPIREEVRYFIDSRIHKKYIVADVRDINKIKKNYAIEENKGLLARALNLSSVEVMAPADINFSIVIPKIAANAKIISNVDTVDSAVYLKALKQGVAHANGTAFPGKGKHIFLFAHSTDYFWNIGTYNSIFYLLYKLEKGDEVNIFYQGKRYLYQVTGSKIVDPSEVEYLTRETNKEFLTLQTCWPLGTALKRLLVFAQRVRE